MTGKAPPYRPCPPVGRPCPSVGQFRSKLTRKHSPGALSESSTRPQCSSAIALTSDSPRPVPRVVRLLSSR